jgi:hypothetical protein
LSASDARAKIAPAAKAAESPLARDAFGWGRAGNATTQMTSLASA